ncbi:MAG: porin [Candidatus Omnitrophota bacterium]
MSRRLIGILALAFALGITCAAYAEVQNVKVSGDITAMYVSRHDFDLSKTTNYDLSLPNGSNVHQDNVNNFLTIARVRVDADLTDNVSATFRLINERSWDGDSNNNSEAKNLDIDLAYVTLKEFLYSPLSLTIGRQELRYGNGLIIGDPDTNAYSNASSLPTQETDLSYRKAFDAAKAVLNYDPLTVDVIFAKTEEGTVSTNDDTDLYGINANYAVNKETTVEGYMFSKVKQSGATQYTATQRTTNNALTSTINKHDSVNTIGGRIVNSTIKNLTAQIEAAYQFGKYNPAYDINSPDTRAQADRKAWALQAIATYDLAAISPEAVSKYKPSIKGGYSFFSGEKSTDTAGDYHGWDPMYKDQTIGHVANRIMRTTNMQIFNLSGKVMPMDDVTLTLDYANFNLNKKYPVSNGVTPALGINTVNLSGRADADTYRMTNKAHLGQEIDATITYDYTEDVQFNFLGGMFIPGNAFHKDNRTTASEFIGSMKVTF